MPRLVYKVAQMYESQCLVANFLSFAKKNKKCFSFSPLFAYFTTYLTQNFTFGHLGWVRLGWS